MKARLITGAEISNTEMLAIGTEVEIVDGHCGTDGYYYTCKIPDGRQINIKSDFLEITDFTPYIDWRTRRYELAKAAMQGILSNESQVECAYKRACHRENGRPAIPNSVVRYAVECADALIKELKIEKNK